MGIRADPLDLSLNGNGETMINAARCKASWGSAVSGWLPAGKWFLAQSFRHGMRVVSLVALLLAVFGQSVGAAVVGAALVKEDASLQVKGRTIRLFGIYIPPTGRSCQSIFVPIRCGSRAALALDFKIQGFVHCEERARHTDGSLIALCRVNRNAFSEGEDLSAYLISLGWAAALPDAPYEYSVMEDIARQRGLGVWGFPADSIQRYR